MSEDDLRRSIGETVGRPVVPVQLDLDEFADFKTWYRDERDFIDDMKLIEYYISFKWLAFEANDVYIDVAAQNCPFAPFVHDRFGTKAYRQDLYYMDRGIHDTDIGGSASHIPLRKGSVTKMSLHNSLEHFEGRSDTGFIREAQRLLGLEGKLIVVPLFIRDEYSEVKDAGWIDDEGVKHLWGIGARFARWYDPAEFHRRILRPAKKLTATVFYAENISEVHPHCYPYFVVFQKVAP
jgi:hypothetical protein